MSMRQLNIKITQEQYDYLWQIHTSTKLSMGAIVRDFINKSKFTFYVPKIEKDLDLSKEYNPVK